MKITSILGSTNETAWVLCSLHVLLHCPLEAKKRGTRQSQETEARKAHLSSTTEDNRALPQPAHLLLRTIINNCALISIWRKTWLSSWLNFLNLIRNELGYAKTTGTIAKEDVCFTFLRIFTQALKSLEIQCSIWVWANESLEQRQD